jgi:hypothetical protein
MQKIKSLLILIFSTQLFCCEIIAQNTNVKIDSIVVDHTPSEQIISPDAPDYSRATLEKTEAPNRVKEILPNVDFYIRTVPSNGFSIGFNGILELIAKYNGIEYNMPNSISGLYMVLNKTAGDEESLELLIYLQMWFNQVSFEHLEIKPEKFDLNNEIKIEKIQIKEMKKYDWTWYSIVDFTYKEDKYEALFNKRFNYIEGISIYKNGMSVSGTALDFLIKKQ